MSLKGAMAIALTSAALAESMMPAPKPEQFIREEKKVGRNEPCPCGSGKKNKKCCNK